jgi:hypothetical protein
MHGGQNEIIPTVVFLLVAERYNLSERIDSWLLSVPLD